MTDTLSHSHSFSYSKRRQVADHLFEGQILDENGPPYVNQEIVDKVLKKNNSFSRTLISSNDKLVKNRYKSENIYENLDFIENTINLMKNKALNQSLSDDEMSSNTENDEGIYGAINIQTPMSTETKSLNTYTSTLSLTIGKSYAVDIEAKPTTTCEVVSPSTKNAVKANEVGSPKHSDSFKSSYAKSLMDSFQKSNSESTMQSSNKKSILSKVESCHSTTYVPGNEPLDISGQTVAEALSNGIRKQCSQATLSKTVRELEKRLQFLSEVSHRKDKELEKMQRDFLVLKMEHNKLRAENRLLRTSVSARATSPCLSFVDSQPSSIALSTDSDTWTLQQQVAILNGQLEKAELSRRAYENATKQLVQFLRTINTTLSTVSSSDCALDTSLDLQDLSALVQSPRTPAASYQDSTSDGSFVLGKSQGVPLTAPSEKTKSRVSFSSQDTSGSSPVQSINGINSEVKRRVISSASKSEKKSKATRRRFSSSGKALNSTKASSYLVRSESVHDLPSNAPAYKRLSRAVSTHCVVSENVSSGEDRETDDRRDFSPSGNRLVTSKAKDFFSSLKNVFKSDVGLRESNGPSSTVKKKKRSLSRGSRSDRLKSLEISSPIISDPSSFHKRFSDLEHLPAEVPSPQKENVAKQSVDSRPNSVFYVPYLEDSDSCLNETTANSEVSEKNSTDELSSGSHPVSPSSSVSVFEPEQEEMSGPQELSVNLSIAEAQDSPVLATTDGFVHRIVVNGFDPPNVRLLATQTASGSSLLSVGAPFSHVHFAGGGSNSSHSLVGVRDRGIRLREFGGGGKMAVESFGPSVSCGQTSSSSLPYRVHSCMPSSNDTCLPVALWKVARGSFRAKHTRLAFV